MENEALVYVRTVPFAQLPADVRAQVKGASELYALHKGSDGAPFAFVTDRDTAFMVARKNKLEPHSVH